MGPTGNDGLPAQKSVLYNTSANLTSDEKTLVVLPYNGSLYTLDSCLLVVNSATGTCHFQLVDITASDNEVVLGELDISGSGLQVVNWSDFSGLDNKLSVLVVRGITDGEGEVLALEFNMT